MGSKYYIMQTRAAGKAAKRVTVGRYGIVTAEDARKRVALIIARIKAGELAQQWLDEQVEVRCRAKTVEMYRPILGKHLLPALAVDRAKVTALHHSMRATPSMANRTVDVLSRRWNATEDRGSCRRRAIPAGSSSSSASARANGS